MRSSAGSRTAARCSGATQSEAVGESVLQHRTGAGTDGVEHHPMMRVLLLVSARERGRWSQGRHTILVRERGPRLAPTLEPARVLRCLRGLPIIHGFAHLKPTRPRPLSCRASRHMSFAEIPPSRLDILAPHGRGNTVAVAGPGHVRIGLRVGERASHGR